MAWRHPGRRTNLVPLVDLPVQYDRGGIRLPSLGLYLDSPQRRKGHERVFVSHAHSDHIAAHREILVSEPTARLLAVRMPGQRTEHRLSWRTPATFEHDGRPWRLTLYPAGHVLGSAMAFVEANDTTLLYTGDFKLRPGLAAEPCEPVPADTLIMETTFGRPEYVFPPAAEVIASVIAFCREALAHDETPVLLGYSLGKSQEILRGLAGADLPIALHPRVTPLTRVYQECGVMFPPYHEATTDPPPPHHVLLCPPGADLETWTRGLGRLRRAVLTGWALDPRCRFRYRADAAFPLSDHADFPELLEFVRRVNPRRVLTLHGFAADFAAAVRREGFDARALSEDEQLTLGLSFP